MGKESESASDVQRNQGIRYAPMLANLVLTIAALQYVWFGLDTQRANLVIATFAVAITSALWFLFWLVFRSRIPSRPKWITVSIVICLVAITGSSFKIKGYTGDLVPIIGLRWSFDSNRPSKMDESDKPQAQADVSSAPAEFTWPQFLGPARNGVVSNVALDPDWESRQPTEIWRWSIGSEAGFSSFAVDGGRIITQLQDADQEVIVCCNIRTGTELWRYSYAARYQSELGGVGPRATPAVDESRVYAYGATGILTCLDSTQGQLIWQRNVVDEHGADVLEWGHSCSPLVLDGRVIVSTGLKRRDDISQKFATLAAYDKQSGKRIWSAGSDSAGYASPIHATLAGVPQIVMVNSSSITGHELTTGNVLWKTDLSVAHPIASQPAVFKDNQLLISKGYGVGAKLIQITRLDSDGALDVKTIWKSARVLQTKYTSAVIHGNYAYALSDGRPECIDLTADGRRRWKARGDYGHGQMLLIGGLILVQCEGGDVALLETNPKKLVEIARFTAFDYRTWNSPVVVGNLLLVRNDHEMACFELPLLSPKKAGGQ
jgi:outer membrane protein assembly factor BamB